MIKRILGGGKSIFPSLAATSQWDLELMKDYSTVGNLCEFSLVQLLNC